MSRCPPYGGAVLLALGRSSTDGADRALVVAALAPGPDRAVAGTAAAAVVDGADVVELDGTAADADADADAVGAAVAAVRVAVDVAVGVRTAVAAVAGRALASGAVLVADPTGFADDGYLAAVVAGGGSVVGAAPAGAGGDPLAPLRDLAARARAGGVPPGRLAVELVVSPDADLRLPGGSGLRCLGAPVLVSVVRRGAARPDPAAVAGPLAVAVVRGARLLRVAPADVRAARRVADVVAAVRRGAP